MQLSAMQEGDYTYQLIVTDSAGHQSTAEVTVIVQPGKLPLPAAAASLPGVEGEQQSVSNILISNFQKSCSDFGPFWAGILLINEQNKACRNIVFVGRSLISHIVT